MEEEPKVENSLGQKSKSIADFIEEHFELDPGKHVKLEFYQRDILECPNPFRIINKARQIGVSTVISWEALAYALLVPNQTILLISVSERQATELLAYIKRILDNFKLNNHVVLLEETKTHVRLDNNSRIISLPNSVRTVQGIRANRVYIDEFSLFEQDKAMLDAIIPSISHGGCITIVSRPFGKRGEFYRIFNEAQLGKGNFTPFEIPWTSCNIGKYREGVELIRKGMDELAFQEQYNCQFLDEATSFFPYEILIPCLDENMTGPRDEMNLKFGIDFGRKINATVVTVVEFKENYRYVRHLKEFTGTNFSTQLQYINDRIKEWKPNNVTVDDFGLGMRLFEELREKHGGMINPAHLDVNTKNAMINELRMLFEDKKIRIPRNDKLLQQLHALLRSMSGGVPKWEPGKTEDYGRHDDYVWSLCMAVCLGTINQLSYFIAGDAIGNDTSSDDE
jgi:phage FluMu gp28-like protein